METMETYGNLGTDEKPGETWGQTERSPSSTGRSPPVENPLKLDYPLGETGITVRPATRKNTAMTQRQLVNHKRAEILRIAAHYGARNLRVFGSVARNQTDEQSDIDFLVDMEPGRSLFDLGGLQSDLQAALGRPVDVVTEKGLKPRIRARVLEEAIPL